MTKPAQQSAKTLVTTTQQRAEIHKLMQQHLVEGGSMLAQVFPDGLRIRVLTPAQTNQLQGKLAAVLGEQRPGLHFSAFDNTKGAQP